MKFSKFFQYAYLIFAALFILDASSKYKNTGEIAYASIILGVTAVFMYFFKRKMSNKYKNPNGSN